MVEAGQLFGVQSEIIGSIWSQFTKPVSENMPSTGDGVAGGAVVAKKISTGQGYKFRLNDIQSAMVLAEVL